MKRILPCISFLLFALTNIALAQNQIEPVLPAESPKQQSASPSEMREDQDGTLEVGEYEIIDLQDSVRRSLCPYTCEMRGIPKAHCKAWRSVKDPEQCYVQDTRLKSEAIKW